ncbi:MAG: SPFH domain-containing protein [Polyangiaceae bacterium]
MGIWDFAKSEARQMAIARPDQFKHLIVYKHPDETIAKWSQVTVDSDEGAVFFREGRVHGILGAGRHTLDGAMYPFLTGLIDKYAGGDVFKSEIFFVRTQPLRNDPVKFGANIAMTDPVTQMPCKPMIHGEFVVRVMDPVKFIIGLTGQSAQIQDNQAILRYVSEKFKGAIRQPLGLTLKQTQTSVLEADMVRDQLEDAMKKSVPELDEIGLQITELIDFVVKLSPQDREKVERIWEKLKVAILEKRAELEMRKMEIEVDVAERQQYVDMAGNQNYMRHAQAEAMLGAGQGMAKGGDGAGLAAMGAQMAVGMGMGGMMHQGFAAPQYQHAPPPQPGGAVACRGCGFQNNGGGKFCANCGQPLAPPAPPPQQGGFCSNCGSGLAAGAKFCANCGTPQQAAPPGAPQAGYPQAPQGGPPQGGQYAAPPQPGYPQAPQGGYPAPPPGGYPPAGGHGGQGGGQPQG